FARYSVIGSCATALGVLAAAFPDYATAWTGCSRSTAMQLMFGLYAFLGLGAFLLYRPLSPAVEVADRTPEARWGLQRSSSMGWPHSSAWIRLAPASGAVAAGALALSGLSGFGDDNRDDPVLDRGLFSGFLPCRRTDRRAHRAHQYNGVHAFAVQHFADPDP